MLATTFLASTPAINITPNKPGFAVGAGYLFYAGSVAPSATLPFGGIPPTLARMCLLLISASHLLSNHSRRTLYSLGFDSVCLVGC